MKIFEWLVKNNSSDELVFLLLASLTFVSLIFAFDWVICFIGVMFVIGFIFTKWHRTNFSK